MAASQVICLNVFMPVIIYNYLHSVTLLADVMRSFDAHCLSGLTANRETMERNLHHSLMLVTCLNGSIGYENAAKAARLAFDKNLSLKEAVLQLKLLTEEEFGPAGPARKNDLIKQKGENCMWITQQNL